MSFLDYGLGAGTPAKALNREHLTTPSNLAGITAVIVDMTLLAAAVVCTITADAAWLRICASIVAGTAISTLFILGHDAAHGSLFTSKLANQIMSRALFLPCLHNPTLWLYQHNHLHHQHTNLQGANSFSPMAPAQYQTSSFARRLLERIYRHPLGFGLYYLVERWWKHKFLPRANAPSTLRPRALRDFRLLVLALAGFMALVSWNAIVSGHSPVADIFFAIVLPFYVWNHLMGFTAFVQHTHPRAHWMRARRSRRHTAWQIDVTVCVKFPRWYDLLSHNIMHHPAHHENPRVPWYRLPLVEQALPGDLRNRMLVERISLGYLIRTAAQCKLFDYDGNFWTDFNGRRTS